MSESIITVKDAIEITGKTILSVIPIGGTLATAVYDTIKGNVLQKRQKKWMNIVEQRLVNLEIALDDLGQNENFATMLIKTTEVAMKTQKEEKLNYLANALLNSINAKIDEDKLIVFMALVEKYTVCHIKILDFFNEPTKFSNINENNYSNSTGSPTAVLSRVYPDVMEMFDICWKDLYNDSLVSSVSIRAIMTGQGMIAKRTTQLGDEFLKFLNKNEEKNNE